MAKVGGILYIQCMSGNMVILVMMDLLTLTEPRSVRALNDATFFLTITNSLPPLPVSTPFRSGFGCFSLILQHFFVSPVCLCQNAKQ